MMKRLLIGTHNTAKFNTYKDLLKNFKLSLVSAKELNIAAPEENGSTFEETAIAKAKYYFEQSGLPSLVDDAGLEIEALNGEPGVKSNRWIGRQMTDEEIIAEVIKRMEAVPSEKRNCKHVVVMALATSFGIFTSYAEIIGVVPERPSEKRIPGYAYRPVVFLPNYNKYWIDLSKEEDEILDHRRHAIEKIQDILKELEK